MFKNNTCFGNARDTMLLIFYLFSFAFMFIGFNIDAAVCSSVGTSEAIVSVVAVRSNFGIGVGCSSG